LTRNAKKVVKKKYQTRLIPAFLLSVLLIAPAAWPFQPMDVRYKTSQKRPQEKPRHPQGEIRELEVLRYLVTSCSHAKQAEMFNLLVELERIPPFRPGFELYRRFCILRLVEDLIFCYIEEDPELARALDSIQKLPWNSSARFDFFDRVIIPVRSGTPPHEIDAGTNNRQLIDRELVGFLADAVEAASEMEPLDIHTLRVQFRLGRLLDDQGGNLLTPEFFPAWHAHSEGIIAIEHMHWQRALKHFEKCNSIVTREGVRTLLDFGSQNHTIETKDFGDQKDKPGPNSGGRLKEPPELYETVLLFLKSDFARFEELIRYDGETARRLFPVYAELIEQATMKLHDGIFNKRIEAIIIEALNLRRQLKTILLEGKPARKLCAEISGHSRSAQKSFHENKRPDAPNHQFRESGHFFTLPEKLVLFGLPVQARDKLHEMRMERKSEIDKAIEREPELAMERLARLLRQLDEIAPEAEPVRRLHFQEERAKRLLERGRDEKAMGIITDSVRLSLRLLEEMRTAESRIYDRLHILTELLDSLPDEKESPAGKRKEQAEAIKKDAQDFLQKGELEKASYMLDKAFDTALEAVRNLSEMRDPDTPVDQDERSDWNNIQ